MTQRGQTWLAVNSASGSNDRDAVNAVVTALEEGGRKPDRVIDISREDAPSRDGLDGVGLVAVFAGDGTVNALVTGLEGWNGDVLVLPGGTANLLARALHGEADAAEIARRAGAMRPVRRSCVRTGGGTALIEVLAGPGAMWSDVREDMREGELAAMADSAVAAVKQSTSGPMVRIADPAMGREEGYAGVRLEPGEGGFAVSGYGAQGVGDLVKQGIALLRRDFREGPHDELGSHARIRCESVDGSPIELMIDGERSTGASHETFSLAPLAVNLLSSSDG
ncbi:MAG: diacylglycerol kinase [Novosphingobium sp.]|nr:diacylglycerol kinase [Novosphingobium sp.]